MIDVQDTNRSHWSRGWILSLLLLIIGIVYISSFWGMAAGYLPEPLNRWVHFFPNIFKSWLLEHFQDRLSEKDRNILAFFITSVIMAMIIPTVVLAICRRKPTDVGIGWPNALGRRMIIVSVVLSIPFGFWLLTNAGRHPSRQLISTYYVCVLLLMIPEHYLICGIYTAIMLPGRKLPNPVPVAPLEGSLLVRGLRWLGLAQPSTTPDQNRGLAWFGLTGVSLLAICVSGALFGMVHFGKNPLELALSFPGGVAVAYMTLRSHSIWPAILAHWSMNLIPLGLLALFQA